MKTKFFTFLFFITIPAISSASVGVVIGANKFAQDGMPFLQKNEQVKVFFCHGKTTLMSGEDAQTCALKKCLNYFKISSKKTSTSAEIIGGKCKKDGWSERNGYALAYTGNPGDNQFMFSKAIGDKTKEEAQDWVKKNKFPINNKNKAFDFYDDGKNGKDVK